MVALIATAGAGALSFQSAVYAGDQNDRGAAFPNAVGSWFGRAVPVPGEVLCEPGPGCLVPPEVMMVFTVNADGTFIAIDAGRVPAHGQWERKGPRSIKAAFTLMQVGSTTGFIGSFKNLFEATLVNPDEMRGTIEAHLYAYVDPSTGAVIVDSDGFPTPNPLEPAALCSTTAGCTDVGRFSFIVRRVKVQ
ncbi:MAG TPA: hypothetical protein VK886_08190 [Vicinamibacterales bacterium]|nr:hypothetical protein [Vicinamibacterales bacterium]